MSKLTTKKKVIGIASVLSLLAALFAPQIVGTIEAIKTVADQTDCAGLCPEEGE